MPLQCSSCVAMLNVNEPILGDQMCVRGKGCRFQGKSIFSQIGSGKFVACFLACTSRPTCRNVLLYQKNKMNIVERKITMLFKKMRQEFDIYIDFLPNSSHNAWFPIGLMSCPKVNYARNLHTTKNSAWWSKTPASFIPLLLTRIGPWIPVPSPLYLTLRDEKGLTGFHLVSIAMDKRQIRWCASRGKGRVRAWIRHSILASSPRRNGMSNVAHQASVGKVAPPSPLSLTAELSHP